MSKTSCRTVIILSLIAILLLTRFSLVPGEDAAFQRVFQTHETVRNNKAQEMRRHINLAANPCNDFYEYACGNWAAEGTPQSKLESRIDVDLLRLLEETAHRKDSALAREAKNFYRSCLAAQAQQGQQSQQQQQQQQFLSDFIQQNGGFPAVPGSNWPVYHQDYDWLQVIARLRKNYGMDILIGLRVGYNYANVQENSIYLSEPSTLIPQKLCSRRRLDIRDLAYESIERMVASQLKSWLAMGNEASDRLAADIVSFEHELCGGMRGMEPWDSELQLYRANFTRKATADLGQLYKIDFESYVSNSFGQSIFRPVYMAAPDYYAQLRRTLDAHNGSLVANYIMYRAVAALTFPLEDKQAPKPTQRPIFCLEQIKRLLPSALGELYARQYVSEELKQQLVQIYGQLKDALQRSVSAEWLEEGSRRIAQRKLSDIQLLLPSYEKPQQLRLQLERSNYWHNLRLLLGEMQSKQLNRLFEENIPQPADPVEAYEARVRYRPVQRRLELGWALLQPPDYDERYGHSLRHATLGTALAEHLGTAFDELHWSVGLLERDNWDGLTAWRYRNRSDCFSRQVEEYLSPNATATQLLITGSVGLNVAFHGYLTWLGFQAPNNDFTLLTKETLPGLNYSNTALFFLAFAQQHCHPKEQQQQQREQPDPWSMLIYSVRQNHTWRRLQVNGPLSNLVDFAREFHCPAGSPMNPADKCVIY